MSSHHKSFSPALLFNPWLFTATAFAEVPLGVWLPPPPPRHAGHAAAPSHPSGLTAWTACCASSWHLGLHMPSLSSMFSVRKEAIAPFVQWIVAEPLYSMLVQCHFREAYDPVCCIIWVNKGNSPSMRIRPAVHFFLSTSNKFGV